MSCLQDKCHPQTIAVCQTRADGLGLQAEVVKGDAFEFGKDVCGMLVQYPDTHGTVSDYKARSGGRGLCGKGGVGSTVLTVAAVVEAQLVPIGPAG
jgi:hypothetical protein